MKTTRTIILILIVTIISIGYVHQKVEIIKSGYDLQKSRKYLSSLVDQNSNLMYNLSKLESPRYLLATLKTDEIEFAKRRSIEYTKDNYARADLIEQKKGANLFVRMFDVFTPSAEARPRE